MTYLAPTDSELTLACWASNAVGRQEIPCLIHIVPASKCESIFVRDENVNGKLIDIEFQNCPTNRNTANFGMIQFSKWYAQWAAMAVYRNIFCLK